MHCSMYDLLSGLLVSDVREDWSQRSLIRFLFQETKEPIPLAPATVRSTYVCTEYSRAFKLRQRTPCQDHYLPGILGAIPSQHGILNPALITYIGVQTYASSRTHVLWLGFISNYTGATNPLAWRPPELHIWIVCTVLSALLPATVPALLASKSASQPWGRSTSLFAWATTPGSRTPHIRRSGGDLATVLLVSTSIRSSSSGPIRQSIFCVLADYTRHCIVSYWIGWKMCAQDHRTQQRS